MYNYSCLVCLTIKVQIRKIRKTIKFTLWSTSLYSKRLQSVNQGKGKHPYYMGFDIVYQNILTQNIIGQLQVWTHAQSTAFGSSESGSSNN